MTNEEDIQAQIREMEAKLAELNKRKEELAKPLEITIDKILFTGFGGFMEVKLSKYDETVINRLRYIPSRKYIAAREVNQFNIDDYDRLIYELNELNIKPITSPEVLSDIERWKTSPDFILSFDKIKGQIKIDRTIKQKNLAYQYHIASWTSHSTLNYYSFNVNELLEWMKIQHQLIEHYKYKFAISDEVQELFNQQMERERLINEFATMQDAPDVDFKFELPDGKVIELKPDQRVACKFDDTFGNRSLISFDMGKGKTAIAIAQAERHNERVLFICKADLKTNIKREIKKFTGKDAHVFSGIEPDGLSIDMLFGSKKSQYNILNYDVIGREIKDQEKGLSLMKWVEVINVAGFDRIVYDEAHYMKNMEAQRSKGGRALKAPKVMLLTGTPIVNRPGELFPILNIIDPITFYDYPSFVRQFTVDGKQPKNLDKLHGLLKKYMIRRLRDTSNDPNRINQYHTLSSQARINYARIFDGIYQSLRNPDYEREVHNILTELLRCKQICADDKVDFTVDLVETALDEMEYSPWNKVLVYSQFKNTQAEITKRLGPKCRIINGDVTDKARYDLVDQFMDTQESNPKLKVIVTNIVEGLTLTQAGTVIINDLPWTPKDTMQFEGRAFGRTNDPHGGNAYYILAEDTIDEMIWELLQEKIRIAKEVVDDVYTESGDNTNSIFSQLIKMIKGK